MPADKKAISRFSNRHASVRIPAKRTMLTACLSVFVYKTRWRRALYAGASAFSQPIALQQGVFGGSPYGGCCPIVAARCHMQATEVEHSY